MSGIVYLFHMLQTIESVYFLLVTTGSPFGLLPNAAVTNLVQSSWFFCCVTSKSRYLGLYEEVVMACILQNFLACWGWSSTQSSEGVQALSFLVC